MTDPMFETTMEQRLQSAMLEYLDTQRVFMVQWNQAQDILLTLNCATTIGLAAVVFVMAMRLHRMEVGDRGK